MSEKKVATVPTVLVPVQTCELHIPGWHPVMDISISWVSPSFSIPDPVLPYFIKDANWRLTCAVKYYLSVELLEA